MLLLLWFHAPGGNTNCCCGRDEKALELYGGPIQLQSFEKLEENVTLLLARVRVRRSSCFRSSSFSSSRWSWSMGNRQEILVVAVPNGSCRPVLLFANDDNPLGVVENWFNGTFRRRSNPRTCRTLIATEEFCRRRPIDAAASMIVFYYYDLSKERVGSCQIKDPQLVCDWAADTDDSWLRIYHMLKRWCHARWGVMRCWLLSRGRLYIYDHISSCSHFSRCYYYYNLKTVTSYLPALEGTIGSACVLLYY